MGSQHLPSVRAMVFPHPLRLPPLRLHDQVLCFPRCHELLIGRAAQSLRKMPCAAGGFSLYHRLLHVKKLRRCAPVFLWQSPLAEMCSSTVNELVLTRARLIAELLKSNLTPVPICLRSRPSHALPSRKVFPRGQTGSRCTGRLTHVSTHTAQCRIQNGWAARGIPTTILLGFALWRARTVASCASASVKSRFSSHKATPRNGRVVSTLIVYRFSRCVFGWSVWSGLIATIFLSITRRTRR